MNCIILAAGFAKRMYPLTADKPKALLPIAGKPIINHILEKLSFLPITSINVVVNSTFFRQFEKWQEELDDSLKKRIILLDDGSTSEQNRRGAIGALHFALSIIPEDDTLVIAGDNFFSFSLLDFYKAFCSNNTPTIALRDIHDRGKARHYGVAEIDKKGKIMVFEEKPQEPKSTLASTACYFLPKNIAHDLNMYVSEHKKTDNLGNFISWLIKKREVRGFIFDSPWYDIGTLNTYESLKNMKF